MCNNLRRTFLEKEKYERMLDFNFETTFWEEFSIAETYGVDGIIEHWRTAFEQRKDNLKYLTELVLVLNLKIACWYGVNDMLGLSYEALWKETDAYAMDTLKGEDLHYYLSTLD